MKRYGLLVVVIAIYTAHMDLYAQASTGLAFLKIGAGARAVAMGGAYTAVADDASAPFWNPAGATWLNNRQLHFTHNEWIQDVNHEAASVVLPRKNITMGMYALLTSVSGIEQRLIASEEPLGTISSHDFAIGLSFAGKLGQNISIGINTTYLHEKIYIESASGFAVDLGAQYRNIIQGLSCGASLQNFGFTSELRQERINLPRTVRSGLAYILPLSPEKRLWMMAVDFIYILDDDSYVNIGSELRLWSLLALRTGYQTGHETRDMSFGFGISMGQFHIDYAYVPFKESLGNSHRFSFSLNF